MRLKRAASFIGIVVAALVSDVRRALRALRHRPLFLSAAVFSIAIGAGLNLGIYSVIRHVLVDTPLTAAAPDRFMRIEPGISFPHFRDLRHVDAPIDLVAMQMSTLSWRADGAPRPLAAHIVSDNFFETVSVQAVIGRTFTRRDGVADTVVLSFSFWERQLHRDPNAIGQPLDLNGWPYTIIGVLPAAFAVNPMVGGMVYVPISPHVTFALDDRRAMQFDLIGRLRPGVSREQGIAGLRVAATQAERLYPEAERGFARQLRASSTDVLSTLKEARSGMVVLGAAGVLYGLVGLVVVIACANVAGLVLIRTEERRHETAVCLALGASRVRLVQQAFAEPLVIGMLGSAAGVGLWTLASVLLQRLIATRAMVAPVALSAPIPFAYACALFAAITIGCGAAAAWRALRVSHVAAGGRAPRRFAPHRLLVTGQIAACFVLLTAAAFFVDNVIRLRATDAGFDGDHVVTVAARVPPASEAPTPEQLRKAVAEEPGVEAVSWGSPIGPPFTERLQRDGSKDAGAVSVDIRVVGPHFFDTLRVPLVRGRDITEADVDSAGALPVVVNETFARRYLQTGDSLGQRFLRGGNVDSGRPPRVLQIVGIARDSMARTFGDSRVPTVYVPQSSRALAIRLARVTPVAIAALDERIRTLLPPDSTVTVRRLTDDVSAAEAPLQAAAAVFGLLAGLALVLATVGLYAVIAYAARQRRFEIGVRVALGATRGGVVRLVAGQGFTTIGAGCVLGGAATVLLARLVQRVIVAQPVTSPADLAVVTILLFCAGTMAILGPVSRAARSNPADVLRHE